MKKFTNLFEFKINSGMSYLFWECTALRHRLICKQDNWVPHLCESVLLSHPPWVPEMLTAGAGTMYWTMLCNAHCFCDWGFVYRDLVRPLHAWESHWQLLTESTSSRLSFQSLLDLLRFLKSLHHKIRGKQCIHLIISSWLVWILSESKYSVRTAPVYPVLIILQWFSLDEQITGLHPLGHTHSPKILTTQKDITQGVRDDIKSPENISILNQFNFLRSCWKCCGVHWTPDSSLKVKRSLTFGDCSVHPVLIEF